MDPTDQKLLMRLAAEGDTTALNSMAEMESLERLTDAGYVVRESRGSADQGIAWSYRLSVRGKVLVDARKAASHQVLMKDHPLSPDASCPSCGGMNLSYKEPGYHGDLYRCRTCLCLVVHRRRRGLLGCGIAMVNRGDAVWRPCPQWISKRP